VAHNFALIPPWNGTRAEEDVTRASRMACQKEHFATF